MILLRAIIYTIGTRVTYVGMYAKPLNDWTNARVIKNVAMTVLVFLPISYHTLLETKLKRVYLSISTMVLVIVYAMYFILTPTMFMKDIVLRLPDVLLKEVSGDASRVSLPTSATTSTFASYLRCICTVSLCDCYGRNLLVRLAVHNAVGKGTDRAKASQHY